MGLQYRKRTKGKNSWLNFSKSGASLSYKIGNMTFNSRGRSTMNLGNGFRYVAYRKKNQGPVTISPILKWFLLCLVIAGIVNLFS